MPIAETDKLCESGGCKQDTCCKAAPIESVGTLKCEDEFLKNEAADDSNKKKCPSDKPAVKDADCDGACEEAKCCKEENGNASGILQTNIFLLAASVMVLLRILN